MQQYFHALALPYFDIHSSIRKKKQERFTAGLFVIILKKTRKNLHIFLCFTILEYHNGRAVCSLYNIVKFLNYGQGIEFIFRLIIETMV